MPDQQEVAFEEPELIRHGSKYGVNIKAHAPSIHMIQANIETEIAPIVGTQEQAEDLIRYIRANGRESSARTGSARAGNVEYADFRKIRWSARRRGHSDKNCPDDGNKPDKAPGNTSENY